MSDFISLISNAGSSDGTNWLLVLPIIVPIICLFIGIIVLIRYNKKKKARMNRRNSRRTW